LAQSGAITPAGFKKIRKPYEDMLYTLGVKEANVYLPTEQEAMQMIQQSQQHAQQAQQAQMQMAQQVQQVDIAHKQSETQLNTIKGQQIQADVAGNSAKMQLDGVSLIGEHKARAF
jgi:hypothetical protein